MSCTEDKLLKFFETFFFHTIWGFTETEHTKRTCTSKKPINISRTDNIHFKCDFIEGSVKGIRKPISCTSISLDISPGHKIIKRPWIKLHKKNKNFGKRMFLYKLIKITEMT